MRTTGKAGRHGLFAGCVAALAVFGAAMAQAQALSAGPSSGPASWAGGSSLPNAPEPAKPDVSAGESVDAAPHGAKTDQAQGGHPRRAQAGEFDKLIEAGQTAPPSSVGDKIIIGLRGSVSPYAVVGWIGSATYSEAVNGTPNYGQNGKDYLQRLGAAAARATSEDLLTHALMANVLHEDVRYYQMDSGHRIVKRAFYAVSRVLVAKTDGGSATPNLALLTGNLEGAALTQLYYPQVNRSVGQVGKTFGYSLLGQAVGNLFDEFILTSAEFLQFKRRF